MLGVCVSSQSILTEGTTSWLKKKKSLCKVPFHHHFCMNFFFSNFHVRTAVVVTSRALGEGGEHVAHLLGDRLALLLVTPAARLGRREEVVEAEHVRALRVKY